MPDLAAEMPSDWWIGLGMGLAVTMAALVFTLLWESRKRTSSLLEALHKDLPQHDKPEDAHPALNDRRKSRRRKGKIVPIEVLAQGVKAPPIQGFVIDRSTKGLGLALPTEIAPGTIIGVRALDAPPGTPWLELRILRSESRGKHYWRAGGEFPTTPPWNVLLLFG